MLAHSPTGGFWYGEGKGGGDWQNVPCPGRSPGAGPPGCAMLEQGLPAMPCEAQANPVLMSHKSPLPKGHRPSRFLTDHFCPLVGVARRAGSVEVPKSRGVGVRGTP